MKLIFIFWLSHKNVSQILFYQFILQYFNKYENDIDYIFNNTINRLTEIFLKLVLIIFNQYRTINQFENHGEHIQLKTNFASQYRRLNSMQRK